MGMRKGNMGAYYGLSFPGGTVVKNLPANLGDARDADSIPGSGRSPREGNGNPLQYFCLENPMDRGARWATLYGVAKSRTQLSTHMHIWMEHLCLTEIHMEALTCI